MKNAQLVSDVQQLTESLGSKSDADWAIYQRMKPSVQKIRRHHYAADTARDITPVLDKIVQGGDALEFTT